MQQMQRFRLSKRAWAGALVLALGAVGIGTGVLVNESDGSDHQQTAFTELNPRLDITDVFAFPGSSDDRIVLAMTVASPLVGNQGAFFDPNALYELKVDNNQDGQTDVVLQFLFDDMSDGTQRVSVIGPVAANPSENPLPGPISGTLPGGISNRIVGAEPTILRGELDTNLSAELAAGNGADAGTLQVFAGLRNDPFFIDLEQFFRILPDRRPVEGPLSTILDPETAFRPDQSECVNGQVVGDAGPFAVGNGCAVDFLRGFNALAIVVELPESQLTRGQGDGRIGIFSTISR
jgi:hypothetical protein